jgi:hypothetical protein
MWFKTSASQRNVSDWVIGLGGIENKILEQFETPLLCLMMLKYFRYKRIYISFSYTYYNNLGNLSIFLTVGLMKIFLFGVIT